MSRRARDRRGAGCTARDRMAGAALPRATLALAQRAATRIALWALVLVLPGPVHAALPAEVRGLPTLAPMLAGVTPAVVNIAVSQPAESSRNPLQRDSLFRRFFGSPAALAEPEPGAGSGVIIDAERGLVVTNHHVVERAEEIQITLKDRRQFRAQLVGSDPPTDIALLRIQADRLRALPIGDSDSLRVGDFVVAIGNPFGIGQTVTSGIVSALGRSGLGIEGYEDFIQTDASINPGNSGGALVNLRGELVGINTAILGPAQGNVGIGFAIPATMLNAVVRQLLQAGEVRRGRIGLTTSDLTPELGLALGLGPDEGALIERVDADSPAERARLQPGDVVVRLDERPIRSASDLRNRVGLTPAGSEVELQFLRDGARRHARLQVADAGRPVAIAGQPVRELAGARVTDLEPGMAGYGVLEGAAVSAVERGSTAFGHGLRVGDVIYGVNRRRVRTTQDLLVALKNTDRPWRLLIARGESRLGLVIP